MLKENGIEVDIGDTIWKILTDKDNCGHTAIPLQLVESHKIINKEKYQEHLRNTLGQVLQPLGIDPVLALQGKEKVEMDRWFE